MFMGLPEAYIENNHQNIGDFTVLRGRDSDRPSVSGYYSGVSLPLLGLNAGGNTTYRNYAPSPQGAHESSEHLHAPWEDSSSQCDAADRGNRSKPLRELMAAEESANHFDLPRHRRGGSRGDCPNLVLFW